MVTVPEGANLAVGFRGLHVRVCDPGRADTLDTAFSKHHGGRCGVASARPGYARRMERSTETEQQGDYKNALPSEVTDHADSGMPRQLRTQGDDEPTLSRAEADVAGISQTPQVVYADTDENQNAEDQADMNRAGPDQHL